MNPNQRTAMIMGTVAAGMLGLGYAAVPLYDLFCRVTGFGGTTQRFDPVANAATPVVQDKTISVRFDANVSRELPWAFKPERPRDTLSIGARDMMIYTATNMSAEPLVGTASYNVSPTSAGKYFTKVQCFCFTEQRIEPGQTLRMPVLFFVDPKIMDDPEARAIEEITLSYTFHPSKSPEGQAAAKQAATEAATRG